MLPFSCSHRPGVCITRPNCKARSDGGEGRGGEGRAGPSWLVANEAFSLKSASVRWAGWATVTYSRVGKLKTRVGKRKIFFGASRRILPTLAWNPAGAPAVYDPFQQRYLFIYLFIMKISTQITQLNRPRDHDGKFYQKWKESKSLYKSCSACIALFMTLAIVHRHLLEPHCHLSNRGEDIWFVGDTV